MPIHEYRCRACGEAFEFLVRGDASPSCPACSGADLERRLSAFAVGSGRPAARPRPAAGPCGSCGDPRGPGACGLD